MFDSSKKLHGGGYSLCYNDLIMIMKGKVVDASKGSSLEKGYMIMIQESKGKKYNKGLVVNNEAFYTTNKLLANDVCREFNLNSL